MDKSSQQDGVVLLNGADYLDSIVSEMEQQAAKMVDLASASDIPEVRAGYLKFIDTLSHCIDTLRTKATELRSHEL